MNTLCLENYEVSKMEIQEMKTTDGGGPWKWAARALVDALIEAVIWSVENAEDVYGHEVNNPHCFLK